MTSIRKIRNVGRFITKVDQKSVASRLASSGNRLRISFVAFFFGKTGSISISRNEFKTDRRKFQISSLLEIF